MQKEVKQLLNKCRKAGCTVEMRNGGHLAIHLPMGGVVYCPSTPSEHRSLRNVMGKLRRGGLNI